MVCRCATSEVSMHGMPFSSFHVCSPGLVKWLLEPNFPSCRQNPAESESLNIEVLPRSVCRCPTHPINRKVPMPFVFSPQNQPYTPSGNLCTVWQNSPSNLCQSLGRCNAYTNRDVRIEPDFLHHSTHVVLQLMILLQTIQIEEGFINRIGFRMRDSRTKDVVHSFRHGCIEHHVR